MPTRTHTAGLLAAALLAAAAYLLTAVPAFHLVSPMLFAVLLGLVARNLGALPTGTDAGLKYASKTLLRAGVVLLGLRLSLPDVLSLGSGALLVLLITVAATFAAALALGRWLRLARTVTVLTGTGTAICGASAVAGMSAVVQEGKPRRGVADEPVDSAAATALAVVTLCGTLAMFALPALARALGLSGIQAGVWLGASIHEVGQVVAAGGFMGEQVTQTATLTKLGRVVLLAPLVALVGYSQGRRGEGQASATGTRPPLVPGFVLGFVAAILLRSAVDWSPWSGAFEPVFNAADTLTLAVLTMAMAAVGTAVNLKTVVTTGGRALVFGLLLTIVTAAVGLASTLVLV